MGNSMSSRRLAIEDYAISDNTRRLVDDEQADITDVAYRCAHRLITEHRATLEEFAQTLLKQEVLERPDIERVMGEDRVAPLKPAEPGPARIAAAQRPSDS
jgi:cell division protease FtsH